MSRFWSKFRLFNQTTARVQFLLVLTVLLCTTVNVVSSSRGDRDYIFHNCFKKCTEQQCDGDEFKNQKEHLRKLMWLCDDECKYQCMWTTVAAFQQHQVPVPQFFGKWPFTRLWGIQEPASVLFSLFNLLGHAMGLLRLRRNVPKNAPLLSLWYIFGAVCINGWVWSIVFHTRDFPTTEIMDYLSAFSMNAFSFFAVFVRLSQKWMCLQVITTGVLILSFCAYHVHYLVFVHFDYGYNMKANIAMGVLNAACWLFWSGLNRKTHQHVWKCAVFVILAVASLGLEILDFPPFYWAIDAHALWHLVTGPITLVWYSFLIDDCKFLLEEDKSKKLI